MTATTISPDDVRQSVQICMESLTPLLNRDWETNAAQLEWSCRYTLDHTVNALLSYAGHLATQAPERRPRVRDLNPDQSPADLLSALETGAAILADVCHQAPDGARGFHNAGMADATGFAGMGCTEILIHTDDIARAFGVEIAVDQALARRVLDRIFPWAPDEGDAWEILRWASGRTELSGHGRLDENWYWHCAPLAEWDGAVNRRAPA